MSTTQCPVTHQSQDKGLINNMTLSKGKQSQHIKNALKIDHLYATVVAGYYKLSCSPAQQHV